jgi:hypothetical protein
MAAAAQRVGIDPDELDALSDALSGATRPAAVGAGSTTAGLSRRIASIGEFSRFRDGVRARLGNAAGDSRASSLRDEQVRSLGDNDSNKTGDADGFWADPLPGVQTRHDQNPPDPT